MAKVQKNFCKCKSCDELQKIRAIISEMEKNTHGKIPSRSGDPSDQIRMIHGFIKKLIWVNGLLVDQVEDLKKDKKYWQDSSDFWRGHSQRNDKEYLHQLRGDINKMKTQKNDIKTENRGKILHMTT